jgi:hypothetical protein
MTIAVCLKCGAMKHGAWTPCRKCKHVPQESGDVAEHLLATDHYFTSADLKAMAAEIQIGHPPAFDPKLVADLAASVNADLPEIKRGNRSLTMWIGAILSVFVAVMVWGIYWAVKLFMK